MNDQSKDNLIASLQAEIDALRSIIYMMPGNVYWKDIYGRYLGCNKNLLVTTLNMTSPQDLIGKTDHDLVSKEIADQLKTVEDYIINSNEEKSIEETGFDSDGHYAHFLTRKTPLHDRQGKIIGILGVSFDITERKQMEEDLKLTKKKAEEANHAKSKFLAMISHELRTPLASILGFASLLEKDQTSEQEKKESVQYIIRSGNYLLSLINALLDFNKIEKKKIVLEHLPFNLKTVAEDVIHILQGSAKQKNLPLILDFDATIPTEFLGDSGSLQKILVNLIGNAIKFTEKGQVQLTVKCVENKPQKVKLHFSVEDTGIGIPTHEQQAIFKRFYQMSEVYTRKTSSQGTGLGLAIIKKLAKLLGSKIHVVSEPGKGSTFYFTLELEKNILSETKESLETLNKNSLSSRQLGSLKILLVEDDNLVQIIHRKMLEELKCEVDIAESATKALNLLNKEYDFLFVDIGLPDIDGFSLIQKIRSRSDFYKTVPIIALTGYSEKEERQRCMDAGANEVMVKPINVKLLEKALVDHFSSH